MNKVLSLALILALSSASDDFADNNLNFLSKIKDDLKKAGHFVAEHPQIITTAAKLLKDDEIADLELNAKDVAKKIGSGLLTGIKIASKFLDDEATDHELNVLSKIKDDLKKAGHFVVEHPQIITTAAKLLKDDEIADLELNAKDVAKKVGSGLLTGIKIASKFLDDETANDELLLINGNLHFRHGPVVQPHTVLALDDEVADLELNAKDVAKKVGSSLLTGIKIASKFLDDEAAENELNFFSKIKDGLKKAGHFVADHPQIITTAAKLLKDDEFFSYSQNQTHHHEAIKKAQKDVKNLSEILKKLHNHHERRNGTHHDSLANLGQLLHEGRQIHNQHHRNHTVSAKPFKIDQIHDNNLSIKDKLKGVANWVGDHPQVISESAKAIKTLSGKK